MDERIRSRIRQVIDRISLIENSTEKCRSLWECYQRVFVSDDALITSVSRDNSRKPINGVTEVLSVEDFQNSLSMPDTICLGLKDEYASNAVTGFVILRYVGTRSDKIELFKEYIFKLVLCGLPIEFTDKDSEEFFNNSLRAGDLMCSDELVANRSGTLATAIMIAGYKHIALDILENPDTNMIGKCLDSVKIGDLESAEGNIGIRRVVDGLGLRRVGTVRQFRPICLSNNSNETQIAQLNFGIYVGSCKRITETTTKCGVSLRLLPSITKSSPNPSATRFKSSNGESSP